MAKRKRHAIRREKRLRRVEADVDRRMNSLLEEQERIGIDFVQVRRRWRDRGTGRMKMEVCLPMHLYAAEVARIASADPLFILSEKSATGRAVEKVVADLKAGVLRVEDDEEGNMVLRRLSVAGGIH